MWVTWDYLMYIFLLTVSCQHFLTTFALDYLMNIFLLLSRPIILCTFSYYSRVYGSITEPKCLTRHFCNFSGGRGLDFIYTNFRGLRIEKKLRSQSYGRYWGKVSIFKYGKYVHMATNVFNIFKNFHAARAWGWC